MKGFTPDTGSAGYATDAQLSELTAPTAEPPPDIADIARRADALNKRYRDHSATDVLRYTLLEEQAGRAALVSSFGAESVVLLHMAARIDPGLPVLFLETGMLFPETLTYQQEIAAMLGLSDMRLIRPFPGDEDGTLHLRDTNTCCNLRKTLPLRAALAEFDSWISGRKRFQGGRRAMMEFFEPDAEAARLKVNPLAHWRPEDIRAYMEKNRLPPHPLVARGYSSIGCAPCTTPVAHGEDPRAGRWRGENKSECGIHLVDGAFIPESIPQRDAC